MQGLNFITIDLETTGLDKDCEIIEIGMVKYVDGLKMATYDTLIKPMGVIPENIIHLTGITNEMVIDKPVWSTVEEDILNFIGKELLIAHNASFDKGFLERALNVSIQNLWLDTYELAKIFLPYTSSYKLISLAKHFNLSCNTFHRALKDAQVTGEIFLEIIKLMSVLSPKFIDELIKILHVDNEGLVVLLKSIQKKLIINYTFNSKLPNDSEKEFENEASKSTMQYKVSMGEKIFEPGGLMSKHFEHYQFRPQQVEMLKIIIQCFQEDKHAVLEGGTGIGKSFAYLIPSILWSLDTGKKVVVSTHTIALQEQLFNKDIPFLEDCLNHKISAALIKGRSNYVCLRRFERLRENQNLHWKERVFLAQLFSWLETSRTGDKEELNISNHEMDHWIQVSNQSETCLGTKCKFYYKKCFYTKNRKHSESSNLLITNHALLLQDLKTDNKILPKYDYCIIDEAHNLEDEATEQFSDNIDINHINKTCNHLIKGSNIGLLDKLVIMVKEKKHLLNETRDILETSEDLKQMVKSLKGRIAFIVDKVYLQDEFLLGEIRITEKERNKSWWQELNSDLNILAKDLEVINLKLFQIINRLEFEDKFEEILKEFTFHKSKIAKYKNDLEAFILGNDQNTVYWMFISNPYKFRNISLIMTPIAAGKLLNQYLFEVKKSVILTSATLTINNDFNYTAQRYGLDNKDLLTLNAKSPFNYKENSLVCIINDLPDPTQVSEERYTKEIINSIKKIIPNIVGGILILFTSYNLLNKVYYELKEDYKLTDREILAHGINGNRNYLIETMQKTPNTIILGTNSFWEGVDLKGDSLTIVIIVKLPFLPPTRPVIAARLDLLKKEGVNGFIKYSLPQAILKFRQGYGRLIRSDQDKGAVIILDNRVMYKSYGNQFLNSLPPQRVIKGTTEEVSNFLNRWLK